MGRPRFGVAAVVSALGVRVSVVVIGRPGFGAAVTLFVLALLAASCSVERGDRSSGPRPTSPSPTASPPLASSGASGSPGASGSSHTAASNPFGLMLPTRLARSADGMALARRLGAVYYRPASIFLDRWDGSCAECDLALGAGLALVLTVRTSGPSASAPPADLAPYARTLDEVLDRYRPAVLVVENEENSALFYSGTPDDYAQELAVACRVAHERGVPCANGGLVSTLVALLVYDSYRSAGRSDAAADFAARAFSEELRRELDSPRAAEQVAKGTALLAAYRAAGADFANFHWYIGDPQALGEAVAFLRAGTGLPVLTNEIGQVTDDPAETRAIMAKVVELGLPIAVWFGLDGPKARGLVESDGRLRPTGEAFRDFIVATFSGP